MILGRKGKEFYDGLDGVIDQFKYQINEFLTRQNLISLHQDIRRQPTFYRARDTAFPYA